ncbi:hypothetical protein ACM66B_001665 [Microbotryomycetes sp. NB124-2]
MSSPKRRRLSASSSSIGLGETARSPPFHGADNRSRRPSATERDAAHGAPDKRTDKGKQTRKNPLADSDDENSDAFRRNKRQHRSSSPARHHAPPQQLDEDGEPDEQDQEHCAVCLSPIVNKTVVSPCMHGQFCWSCIKAWSDQSRKCPLCLGPIKLLFHTIRSPTDYAIYYLHTLTTTASSSASEDYAHAFASSSSHYHHHPHVPTSLPRYALYGRRHSKLQEDDATWRERKEERALERRRYIYREGLYAKHVASNRFTGFKPFTPQQFASNPDLKARVIKFVRRELQVFPNVDVTFLTTYLVSICSQLDLRSSAAVRLLSDFVSPDDAEHLAHEIVMFARSPFQTLEGFDKMIQYGRPVSVIPQSEEAKQRLSSVAATAKDATLPSETKFARLSARDARDGNDRDRRRSASKSYDDVDYRRDRDKRHSSGRANLRDEGSDGRQDTSYRDKQRQRSSPRECTRDWEDRDDSRLPPNISSRRGENDPVESEIRSSPQQRAGSLPPSPRVNNRDRTRRSITPSESDAISFGNESPRSMRDDDGRWETGLPAEPPLAKSEVLQLAIFGVARKANVKMAESDGQEMSSVVPRAERIIDDEPVPRPSNSIARRDTASAEPSIERATVAGPATDLRAKLQARLTAEYRAALVNRVQAQGSLISNSTLTTRQDLRARLQERLQKEKQLSRVVDRQDVDSPVMGVTRFSDETRRMLLERLEEEKALLGLGPEPVEANFVDSGAENTREAAFDGQTAEEHLRARLKLKALEKQTGELKEKLIKAKLVKAKRQSVQ